jgi:hypothetical protein
MQEIMLMILEGRVQEEAIQAREYQDHIEELSEVQGEAFQQLYVQHEAAEVCSVGKLHFSRSFFNLKETCIY